ncbi:MAG: cellulose synthase subunit BcsC-related outer membrane protein [Rhizorhabdus sp.]
MRKVFGLLTLSASVVAMAATPPALAEAPGVAALLEQARYWQARGRQDRANQAFRRVLAIDPANPAARRGLAGPPRPTAAAVPVRQPAIALADRQPPSAKPVTRRPTATPAGSGSARAAGFEALERGDLAGAGRQFEAALARNRGDADALGGLGLVRLRGQRFVEARDLLQRASRSGDAGKWAEALASARFFAGIAEADQAADAGNLVEAERLAQDLVASDFAAKAPAYDLLGGIYERQGRYAEAARLYAQAGAAGGKDDGTLKARTVRAKALEAAAAGDTAQAEQLFHLGLISDARDPWIRYEFARFLAGQGRRADADSLIDGLRNSGEPDSLYAAALLLNQSDRASDAEAALSRIPPGARTAEMRSLALNLSTDAAVQRAKLLAGRGRTGEAAAMLRQLADAPGLALAGKGRLAEALFELGDGAGAAQVAQAALSASSDDPAAYEPLVRVLAKTGQDTFAMAAAQRAAERAGNSPDGQRAVARLDGILAAAQSDRLAQQGQFAPAFDLLQARWNAAPGNVEVLAALARLYQSGGMPSQAAQTFQMVLNQSPDDKAALIGLVDAASTAGDFARARQAAARAIALSPGDYNVYLAAARMERARGDERAAVRHLKRARELYVAQSGPAAGGFTANNPFAAMAGPGGAFAVAPQPVNPFALDRNPSRAPVAAYAAPAAPGYYPAQVPGSLAPMLPSYQQVASAYPAAPSGIGTIPRAPALGPAPAGDPVLQAIDSDMQALATDTGARADLATGYRSRSGETGLSALKELGGSAEVSTDFAGGRVSAKASAVVLDAGRPSGSGLARFGRNPTAEAIGIVARQPSQLTQADTQHASGVAVALGYDSDLVKGDIGTTPVGFGRTRIAGGLAVTPRLSRYASARFWAERRPVTDSVISYAGTDDPVSGQFWGAVMKTGGGVSLSYDKDGSGIYGDASYHRYAGRSVLGNRGFQANLGGYLRVYRDPASSLTLGVNANYQDFRNNQNVFTFGNGGYFSPQSFLSVSFPVRYARRDGRLAIEASVVPGYQSYDQESSLLFPTDPAAQGQLDALKAQDSDVRSRFDSISKTGFGLSAGGSIYYQVSPNTRVGGEINLNTFGDYDEFKSLLGIRQVIGGGSE